MKRRFKMSLKIRGCEKELSTGWPKGVVATRTFDIEDEGLTKTSLAAGLIGVEEKFIKEIMTVIVEEI